MSKKEKVLILTEKPSVARDFANALSRSYKTSEGFIEIEEYVITWAIGHLLTPYDPEDYDVRFKKWSEETLPILPEEFKYNPIPSSKKQLKIILNLLKRKDLSSIILATDAGREGELIGRLILNESKNKLKTFRFFTSDALTKEVILKGINLARPVSEYDRLYFSGKARQVADWLVGMNMSRMLTLKLGDLFSVGRVQTAVLALLVNRKKEIESFNSKNYFELKVDFKFEKDIVSAHWFSPDLKEEECRKKDDASDFSDIIFKIKDAKAKMVAIKEAKKSLSPDGLYSLTDLQRTANLEFGFSAQKTLEIAQRLYEIHKVLSYPRTESKVMGTSSFDMIQEKVSYFKEQFPDLFFKYDPGKLNVKNKKIFDDERLTDHHGLIPLRVLGPSKSVDEEKIFNLVLRKFISNFLLDYHYLVVEYFINCKEENFIAKKMIVKEIGFKEVLDNRISKEKELQVVENEIGAYLNSQVEAKKTKARPQYTEASLLYDMSHPSSLVKEDELKKVFHKEVGIGTQSTRANIIETLLRREYIKREGRSLIPLPKGIFLVEKLSEIESTKKFLDVKETAIWELSLASITNGEGDVSNFNQSIKKSIHEAISDWKKVASLKSKSPETIKKNSTFVDKKAMAKCPLCQKDVISYPKSYSCSGYKDGCKFVIWKEISGKKITEKEAVDIIKNKKSELLTGFISKSSKEFSAYLIINKEGKIEFQF